MHRLRRHLNYANVTATLALIIAVAGGATAIAGSNAPKNSVTSSSIKPHNVTASDLAGVRVVQETGQFSALAHCRPREQLLGGGGSLISPAGDTSAYPDPEIDGWFAQQGAGPRNVRERICTVSSNKAWQIGSGTAGVLHP